ncbi:MAG: NADH-quinone oxidoreductase subunit L, partial [Hasllibacter sp.]
MTTIILFAPLVGAIVCGLFWRVIGEAAGQWFATSLLFLSAILSWVVYLTHDGVTETVTLLTWIESGTLASDWSIRLDRLTATMLIVITTVSALVHLYSFGYMAHDENFAEGEAYRARFFAYLSLFTFAMLMLVTGDNLVQIFFGWEGVGLASYLLIGFYFRKASANAAAMKAFVVNRVGDFGLLLGILGLFWATGSFDFQGIADGLQNGLAAGTVAPWAALLLCLLVFMGPMAKSAQFPLHVWLPDAMEGPTPISALIHAATMVAAGVFLVARLDPLYAQFPVVQTVIAVVGTITCFLGASIALTQMDLKKGLAYSTVSQLGYMMLAMGCGAPVAGIFHLVTHAFFKAMLFLGSGSVIHAMEEVVGHEPVLAQDMRLMGGLRKKMPVTSITFFIGCIAISGIPPLAGFWSKDEILGQAFNSYPMLWVVGFLTAGMTAFYMFRLYFLTFEGEFRGNDTAMQAQLLTAAGKDPSEHHAHGGSVHESAWPMAAPLAVLAVPSVLIGLLGTPWNSRFAGLLNPEEALEMAENFSWGEFLPLAGASVAISVAGITLAVLAYALHRIDMGQLVAGRFPAVNAF